MIKGNKITIHDISKALNIDSSTVSRALNNSPRVSLKTREKIQKKATELGYQRNSLASNLRTNRTNTIGVIIPRISRHFFATVIAGIEETAYEEGYNVVICQSLESLDREEKIMNSLASNRVDGILISTSMETSKFEHIKSYMDNNNPVVFIDRPSDAFPNCSSISIDNFKASYDATKLLIEKGRKNIAHFSGPQNIGLYKTRKEGYIKALQEHNIPVIERYIFESNLSEEDGIACAKKLLNHPDIDAIYSANDTAAISAIQYLKSQGVDIPNNIAVIGFNNDPISEVIEPSLTTINQPGFEMGKLSTEILIQQIRNKSENTKNESKVLVPELIIRKSSENS
ncbi:LacI family DNA-binding transcriptional regulator [Flavicella marina]|uniref:LacI family DNA-binding transcriptional regulator n=1 Tax=Flavicella marina TaxID=1475951 RepID=UPI001D03438B|nr:LacI family DNA-binding transcriptional regulator [Flavicella marina]